MRCGADDDDDGRDGGRTRADASEWLECDGARDDEAMLEGFPYELGALESMLDDWLPDDETERRRRTTTTTTTNERRERTRGERVRERTERAAGTSSDDGGTSSMSARSAGKSGRERYGDGGGAIGAIATQSREREEHASAETGVRQGFRKARERAGKTKRGAARDGDALDE